VTRLTDIYGLGVCAYEMFTGQVPFFHAELVPLLMNARQQPARAAAATQSPASRRAGRRDPASLAKDRRGATRAAATWAEELGKIRDSRA